jgi:hypothetical protein
MERRRKMPLSFLKDHRRSPGDHIFSPGPSHLDSFGVSNDVRKIDLSETF